MIIIRLISVKHEPLKLNQKVLHCYDHEAAEAEYQHIALSQA